MGVYSGYLRNRLESEENKTTTNPHPVLWECHVKSLQEPCSRIWLRRRNSKRKGGSGGFNIGHQVQQEKLTDAQCPEECSGHLKEHEVQSKFQMDWTRREENGRFSFSTVFLYYNSLSAAHFLCCLIIDFSQTEEV